MCRIMYCERCRWRQSDTVDDEQELPLRCPNCDQRRGMRFLSGTLAYLIEHWPLVRAQMLRVREAALVHNPIAKQTGPTYRRTYPT
jgi:hypothetical protein